jgi:hypothetical protein
MAHQSETLHKIHPLFGILLLGLFVLFNGCGGGSDEGDGGGGGTSAPTISSFEQTSGHVGDTVIIYGTNFSTTPTSNIVKFTGTNETVTVESSTTAKIVVYVPSGASTGTISVTVGGITATSPNRFTVMPDVIPVFAGYYYSGTNNLPCYWDDIGGSATLTALPIGTFSVADAFSSVKSSDGNNTYTAGTLYDANGSYACYWKNNTPFVLTLPEGAGDSYAWGITLSNGVIYIAGSYSNANEVYVACYWEITVGGAINCYPLGDGKNYSEAFGITTYNGTIYVSGFYENGVDTPCYWTGTTSNPIDLDNKIDDVSYDGYAFSIAVSGGTVYTSGSYYYNVVDVPCFWTDQTRTDLINKDNESLVYGFASSIALYNGKVHIAGFYNTGAKDISCYWIDSVLTPLNDDGSEAFSIIVTNDKIYTAGSYSQDSQIVPCYWTNTTPSDLEHNVNYDSSALSPVAWLGYIGPY